MAKVKKRKFKKAFNFGKIFSVSQQLISSIDKRVAEIEKRNSDKSIFICPPKFSPIPAPEMEFDSDGHQLSNGDAVIFDNGDLFCIGIYEGQKRIMGAGLKFIAVSHCKIIRIESHFDLNP